MVSNEMGRVRGQKKAKVKTYLIPHELHHYSLLPCFIGDLVFAYVDSVLSLIVGQGGGGPTACERRCAIEDYTNRKQAGVQLLKERRHK